MARRTLGVALLAFALGCGGGRAPRDAGTATSPKPSLRIAFLTDLKGYLEPCGCTSRPLGGFQRIAGTLDRLQRDGVPTVFVVVGDTFLGGVTSENQAQQDTWQAETVVDLLGELGAAAIVPGATDRTRGDALLASLRTRSRVPFVGVAATGAPIPLVDSVVRDLGGTKVAFVGVTDAFGTDATALVSATSETVRRAKSAGARLVVAMLRGDRRLARSIGQIDGVDFVLQGGLDHEHPEPATARGRAFVLEGGRQGQRLGVLDVFLRDASPMRDESAFTRRVERDRTLREIDAQRAAIARWEHDGTSAADLDAERRELTEMERRARELDQAPRLDRGNVFSFDPIELAPGAPEREAIARRIEALSVRVNDHNRTAFADLAPVPAAPGTAGYVGSAACRSCHEGAYAWWEHHPHGVAYATLTRRHKEYDLACVGCHVTGYGRPGGSTVTHNAGGALVNVGCESCHGPGSLHVANPAATAASLHEAIEAGTCTGCHNQEHSDHFEFGAYRARIVVPGHGLPMGGTR